MDGNPILEAIKTVFRIILTLAIIAIIIWGLHKIYLKYQDDTPNSDPNCQEDNCDDENPPSDENDDDEDKNPGNEDSEDAIQVETIPAQLNQEDYSMQDTLFSKTGQLVADQEIEVFPELSGIVDQILIKEGQTIQAGDTLATLKDSSQLDQAVANYNSALAQLQNAQNTLNLTKQSGNISASTYQNQIRSAQNNIQSALLNLESTKFLRYEQYRLEDSQQLNQQLQAKLSNSNTNETTDDSATTTSNSQLENDLAYNNDFNTIQSRYIQENQGYVQDQQNSLKINDAYNQLDLLYKQLTSTQTQSQLQALNVNNQIIQIQSQLELAKISLEAGEITSPINGVITRININSGERVSQQSSLFVITNFDSLIAETYLSPEELIQLDQNTQVSLEILGKKVPGKIISLALTADPISKTIPVKIKPELSSNIIAIPNTFTNISFLPQARTPEGDPNAFTISTRLLHFKPEGIYIAVAENEEVVLKQISLNLPIKNGQTAIKSGLNNNDLIITQPLGLSEGTKIKL